MEDTEKAGGWQTYTTSGGRERERDESCTVKDTRPHDGRMVRRSPHILSRNKREQVEGNLVSERGLVSIQLDKSNCG